jgi:iron(III) transport system substrate-binding protein
VIVIDKGSVQRVDADTYEELAEPKNQGKVCTRSGSHPYNLSLFGALMEHWGAERTQQWLKGVVSNMARTPKGGDTDQLRALGTGECGITLSNTYYIARLMRSNKPEDKALMERVEVIFPNQASFGTHVNVAGGAVAAHAPHKAEAIRFLEYLVSASAQTYFADGNNEWPVTLDAPMRNPALESWGSFKRESVPVSTVGMNQVKVQQMLDRVGYK